MACAAPSLINIAAVSFAGVSAATVVLPLVNQMNPSADVLSSSTEIDISAIQSGQAIKTSWRKQPVFVRNLTPVEIAEAKKVPLSDLRDPQTLDERTKPGKENLADHAGRLHPPRLRAARRRRAAARRLWRLFLPVPRVRTTTLRRVSAKARRRRDLFVPPYEFNSDTVVTIG